MENKEQVGDYEELLKDVIVAFQDATNRISTKEEVKYIATLTTEKVPVPEQGNKDIAFLRISKLYRPKGSTSDDDWKDETEVHKEFYVFRDMKERVSKTSNYKEQLFAAAVTRLISAGLEYAEVLQSFKKEQKKKETKIEPPTQKLELPSQEDSKIIVTSEMPKELSEQDKAYVEHIKKEKAKLNTK